VAATIEAMPSTMEHSVAQAIFKKKGTDFNDTKKPKTCVHFIGSSRNADFKPSLEEIERRKREYMRSR
jgi:hypothetical protein